MMIYSRNVLRSPAPFTVRLVMLFTSTGKKGYDYRTTMVNTTGYSAKEDMGTEELPIAALFSAASSLSPPGTRS